MAEQQSRPKVKEIKDAYDYLFNSNASLAKIKDAALGGRLFASADADAAGVAGRSLAWKLFLIETEPLQTTLPNAVARCPINTLRTSRLDYQRQLLEHMRAPDGSYAEGFVIPGTGSLPPRSERSHDNLDQNNPLSLHDENPWTAWFASMELRKTILQDVERTFPDIGYFRDQEVQTELTNILFLYSVTHLDIGYRQGMHELLAPLYYAIDYDSIPEEEGRRDEVFREFCSRSWVAADAWTLFSRVMGSAGRWYEWRESKDHSREHTPLPSHVNLSATPDVVLKPYVAPIIEACNRVQSTLLKNVDPQLWRSLQNAGIEPQIYGIRWLRLLFTREFTMEDAMMLWDGLFACDPSFELAPWICVAMLMRIRNNLIPSDYSTQLTFLLRYPSPTPDGSPKFVPPVHPAALLLRQALTLQMSPTSATGTSIINENHTLLNIPTQVPEPPPPPARRRSRTTVRGDSIAGYNDPGAGGSNGAKSSHARMASTPMGLPEMLARGLLERGESLGINKHVMNAYSELKRNIPDLAASLARLPTSPSGTPSSYAAYPLMDERQMAERPPWEPRTRLEVEGDVAEMQSVQRRLGDSVTWIVDTLLLDEEDREDKTRIRERKREALECLSYVRDILKGVVSSSDIEESRLVGEEEMKKRRKALEDRRAAEAAEKLAQTRLEIVPTPPPPTAATLPQFQEHQPPAMRRLPDNSASGYTFPRATLRSPPVSSQLQAARQRAPSPTPTVSVLTPNNNAVPLAPWNHSRSAFSSRQSPIATLPRMPSRPSATASVRHGTGRMGSGYASPQSPSDEGTRSRAQPPPQDPLGVIR